jgi:hypothetical protein
MRLDKMGIFGKFRKKKRERDTSGLHSGELRNIGRKAVQPKCSICGRIITMQATSIAEDIRRSGGVAIGGGLLWVRRCISVPSAQLVAVRFAPVAKDQAPIHAPSVVKVISGQVLRIWYINTIGDRKWEYLTS